MSQEIRTVSGSCGSTVGLNIAPPPPGPTMRKPPGRDCALTTPQQSAKATTPRKIMRCISNPLFADSQPSRWQAEIRSTNLSSQVLNSLKMIQADGDRPHLPGSLSQSVCLEANAASQSNDSVAADAFLAEGLIILAEIPEDTP